MGALADTGDRAAAQEHARVWTWTRCAESVLEAYRLALAG
jgi:hypothetical protein